MIRRRAFIAGTLALAACKKSPPKEGEVSAPTRGEIPRRTLGRTGVQVSMVGIGGYHIGKVDTEKDGIRIVRSAIDRGITFLDNAWDYHAGKSEERYGKALEDGYRAKAFLMTKLDAHTASATMAQLEQSLRRLKTDHIDLVQIHEVIRMSDPEECFRAGGCVEALIAAKNAGKIRFIGFTGHKDPSIHLAMLAAAEKNHFSFDTVQMPLNVMDAHYRSFEKQVLPVLVEKQIGVLGMKCMGAGKILESKRVTAVECLHYAMNLPTSVVITGCDSMGVLEQAIHAALTFRPLAPEQVAELLSRTKDVARDGKFETFKTTHEHDSTIEHPEWLETATI